MNRSERCLQLSLTMVLITLLLLILIPATKAYQTSQSIKTETNGGSSLAERYLMLGDWPESPDSKPSLEQHKQYLIDNSGRTSE